VIESGPVLGSADCAAVERPEDFRAVVFFDMLVLSAPDADLEREVRAVPAFLAPEEADVPSVPVVRLEVRLGESPPPRREVVLPIARQCSEPPFRIQMRRHKTLI
jgi:hypothetical protein